MMKRLMFTAVLLLALPAQAEPVTYDFDKAHTSVLFTVNHLGFSNSAGRFTDFDGAFTLDADNPQNGTVEMTVPVKSVEMDHEKWNAHLLNDDFFKSETHPTLHFKSTAVEMIDANHAKLTGDLTILDTTKPVTFDVALVGTGIHPYNGKAVAGFSATTTIKRSEFGMTYGLPGVGDDVHIRLEVEGHAQGAPASNE